jgi:Spy/CpxP family protein refolding chaperone
MIKIANVFGLVALVFIGAAGAGGASPYAGQEHREVKALSPEEVHGYLAGEGMGLAKAAELNGYPGPARVLELASDLGLSAAQRSRTQAIFAAMKAEARRLGEALVAKERELDRRFASGKITEETLRETLVEIGRLQAELRRAHLQAHLEQKKVLTDAQVARYAALRGYSSGVPSSGGHSHRH